MKFLWYSSALFLLVQIKMLVCLPKGAQNEKKNIFLLLDDFFIATKRTLYLKIMNLFFLTSQQKIQVQLAVRVSLATSGRTTRETLIKRFQECTRWWRLNTTGRTEQLSGNSTPYSAISVCSLSFFELTVR